MDWWKQAGKRRSLWERRRGEEQKWFVEGSNQSNYFSMLSGIEWGGRLFPHDLLNRRDNAEWINGLWCGITDGSFRAVAMKSGFNEFKPHCLMWEDGGEKDGGEEGRGRWRMIKYSFSSIGINRIKSEIILLITFQFEIHFSSDSKIRKRKTWTWKQICF